MNHIRTNGQTSSKRSGKINIFKHVKKVEKQIREKVGIGTNLPPDSELELCGHKLESLENLQSNLKQNFEQYSQAILTLSDSGIALSRHVSKFYKKSKSRQGLVAKFSKSQSTFDTASKELFKERFGWEILKKFDEWDSKIKDLRTLLEKIQQTRINIAAAEANGENTNPSEKVDPIKKISFKPTRLGFTNQGNIIVSVEIGGQANNAGVREGWCILEINGTKHQNDEFVHSEIERIKKNGEIIIITFSTVRDSVEKMRHDLVTKVEALVAERFNIFDDCLHSFIEFQSTLFKITAKEFDQCKPREKKDNKEGNRPSSVASIDIKAHASSQLPKRNESLSDENINDEENIDTPTNSTMPSAAIQPTDPRGSIIHENGPALIQPVGIIDENEPADLIDPIDINSPSDQNPIGNILGFSSPQGQSDSNENYDNSFMGDIFQGPSITPESPNIFFDTDSNIPNNIAEPENILSHDLMQEQFLQGEEKKIKESIQEPQDFLNFGNVETSISNSSQAKIDARLKFVHDLNRQNEEFVEAKISARSRLEEKIHGWEYSKNGEKNDIRTLLSTLDKILWEGARWKKPGLADMLDEKGIKKKYRKAVLCTHPDRLKGKDPEMVVIGEAAFDIINTAWNDYHKTK